MSHAADASNTGEGASSHMPNIHPSTNYNGNVPSVAGSSTGKKKRKNHRAGKKRKGQHKRGAQDPDDPIERTRPSQSGDRPAFYRAYQSDNLNLSGTSLDSDALLDHREHQPLRQRRDSRAAQNALSCESIATQHGLS